ncbi:MAG: hypothetical protein BRD45_06380 [Bacteroidetes bacterium QS_8_64_10]|nr:MAG: hypothetical protein BRD45_06380 [Bacteroidetes bacterium QS_8_64_10]
MALPIIFIHQGYNWYLNFSLRQAQASNPEADIILIGDHTNDKFDFVRHVDMADYDDEAKDFADVYEHLTTNRYRRALVWSQRWFIMKAVLEQFGIEKAFVADSDVLIYSELAQIEDSWFKKCSLGLVIPEHQENYRWNASPEVSYWTQESLSNFCTFLMNSYTRPELKAKYKEKWRYHQESGKPGGVCDMTSLYLFAQDQFPEPVANLTEVREGATFDCRINRAENRFKNEYQMQGNEKKIDWKGGAPYGQNVRLGQKVRFHTLHFQGHAKHLMPSFYRGPAFAGMKRAHLWLRAKAGAKNILSGARRAVWNVFRR